MNFIMVIIYGITMWFLSVSPELQITVSPYQMGLVALGFIFVFLLIIYFFREVCLFQQKEEKTYNTMLTNNILENQLKAVQFNTDKVNKLKHDITNHIGCIEQLAIKSGDLEVQKYCKKLSQKENLFESHYINHAVINAILNYKVTEMKKQKIIYKFDIEYIYNININPVDITGVLSNLIDNAIEANKKLPAAQRYLTIKICNFKGYLLFYVKNRFNKEIKIKDNNFMTTKDDVVNHGLGIKIIKDMTEKYSGIFQQYIKDDFFFSLVMLLNEIIK